MAHKTVIRSSLLVRDVQNPNTTVQKFAVFTGSGNNSLNLMGFRTANELLTDLGFNEAVDDRVSTLLQAGANISLNYDDNGNTLTIAAPNAVTGSGTATQIAFWGGTTGTTSTALSGSSNLYWDNINNRLGINTTNPSATLELNANGTLNTNFSLISNAGAFMSIYRYSNNTTRPRLEMYKSRGTNTAPLTVSTNDELGSYEYYGYNGVGFQRNAIVVAFADSVTGSPTTGTTIVPKLAFGLGSTAGSNEYRMTIFNNGNVAIGNSTTDLNFRLGVVGTGYFSNNLSIGTTGSTARLHVVSSNNSNSTWTAQFHNSLGNNNALMIRDDGNVGIGTSGTTARLVVRGSGDTANTNALLIQNSGGTSSFVVQDDGIVRFNTARVISGFMTFQTSGGGNLTGFSMGSINPFTSTTDLTSYISSNARFWPTSGTGSFTYLNVNPSIDQTGGANGVTRGIFIQPSLVNAPSWRSIEWTNNTGYGLYGSGTAPNYLAGNLSIGTITAAQTLHVAGTMRLTGSTGTGTTLMARNVDGDVSAVTVGSGLSLSNNSIAISTSGTSIVTGSGTATQVAFWGGTNTLSGNSNLYWDNTNNRLGVGTNTPSSKLDIQDVTTSAEIGSTELATAFQSTVVGSWTGSGNTWTHVAGNTNTLTATVANNVNEAYRAIITVIGRTAGSFTYTFKGISTQTISANGTYTNYFLYVNSSNLVVTPTSDFNGTITVNIVTLNGDDATSVMRRNDGQIVYEERASSYNTNLFQGINAGRFNTTGQYNLFQGTEAGLFNISSNFNLFQGYQAGQNNTGGTSLAQGFRAGQFNVLGAGWIAQGAEAGRNNTSGFYWMAQGYQAGQNNTTGSNWIAQGYQAAQNNTSGSSFVVKGYRAAMDANGSNFIAIGSDAGRFVAGGLTGNTSINNSIIIGHDARALDSGQSNQVVIGYLGRGLGSNTTVIGNSSTTQTHLYGNLTLGLTNTPNARMVVTGSGNSDTTWTAQFHNNTGSNNALMIRDDGRVGINTTSPLAQLHVFGTTSDNTASGLIVRNSNNISNLQVRNDGAIFMGPLALWYPYNNSTGVATPVANGGLIRISYGAYGATSDGYGFFISNSQVTNRDYTSGEGGGMRLGEGYAPPSGTGTYNAFAITPTINQAGGANGITRGILIAPTLTSAADFRAIQWQNTTGYGLYGNGAAPNYLAGNLSIGTITAAQTLHVAGTMRLTGSTGTGTTLMARDANGDVSAVTVGSGLSLSNNTLTSTGGGTGTVTGSGTATQIAFWNGLSSITGSANLYWDSTINALERSNGNFSSTGDAQTSDFRLRNIATGGTQVELYLDGVSAKAILSGTNKLWNAKIQVAAIISSAGSGEVVDGDSWVSEHMIGIKKIGSTTSIVGGGVTQNLIAADTSMEGSIVTINADDTNEALRVLFTPSLSVASNTQTRIVATVYLTEVGF